MAATSEEELNKYIDQTRDVIDRLRREGRVHWLQQQVMPGNSEDPFRFTRENLFCNTDKSNFNVSINEINKEFCLEVFPYLKNGGDQSLRFKVSNQMNDVQRGKVQDGLVWLYNDVYQLCAIEKPVDLGIGYLHSTNKVKTAMRVLDAISRDDDADSMSSSDFFAELAFVLENDTMDCGDIRAALAALAERVGKLENDSEELKTVLNKTTSRVDRLEETKIFYKEYSSKISYDDAIYHALASISDEFIAELNIKVSDEEKGSTSASGKRSSDDMNASPLETMRKELEEKLENLAEVEVWKVEEKYKRKFESTVTETTSAMLRKTANSLGRFVSHKLAKKVRKVRNGLPDEHICKIVIYYFENTNDGDPSKRPCQPP